MTWMGRAKRGIGRGTKGYFSLVAGGAKGALGTESIRQTGQMAGSAIARLRMQTCPRCLELSMATEGGVHHCIRTDICGLTGTDDEINAFRNALRVDPRVIALAKGFTGSFDERARGARNISRILWGMTTLILMYGVSWLFSDKWGTATWTLLVGLLCGIQAIRYAYTAHRLAEPAVSSPLRFLRSPFLWFV